MLAPLLANSVASEAAIDSLKIPESQIPHTKTDLNAYAVAVEDIAAEQAPYVDAAYDLVDLINNPQRFPQFTDIYMQRMVAHGQAAIDITNNAFAPILHEANAVDPRIQSLAQRMQQQQQPGPGDYLARQQQAQQQQMQQPMQQLPQQQLPQQPMQQMGGVPQSMQMPGQAPMQQLPQQPVAQPQGTQFNWDDGGMPLAANPNRQGPDLTQFVSQNPAQSWMAVDAMSNQGAFRNKQLIGF